MPLILAVDRDRRQVNQLVSLVHKRLNAEVVQASSAAEGLEALAGRVPDLILTSSLISPKEDGVLAGHLRELGARASHVQTLTIPVLKSSRPRRSKSGVLSKLRRENAKAIQGPDGCEPEAFAEEIRLYLERAAEEQQLKAGNRAVEPSVIASEEPQASLDGLEQFEVDDYPTVEDVAPAQADSVADDDAIVSLETADGAGMLLIDESADVKQGIDTPAIDSAPLSSLDRAFDETIRAAESFADAAVKSSLLLPNTEPLATTLLKEPLPSAASEAGFEPVDDIVVEFAEPAIEEFQAPIEPAIEIAARDQEMIVDLDDAPSSDAMGASSTGIPIDRLVALFADLEPRSIEVLEQPAAAEELTLAPEPVEVAQPDAAADVETSREPAEDTRAAEPLAKPVLDEEELVLLGEAAWKETFTAGLLKDLGLNPKAKKQKAEKSGQAAKTAASTEAKRNAEPPKPIETPAQKEEPKADESAAASSAADGSKENRSKKKNPRGKTKAPAQDEWGLFDPDQCGFSALVEKLDKVTEEPEEQQRRNGTRTRVISY